MTIDERIYKLRRERNLSQAELAKRAGLKAPAISQYESGQRSPSFESLLKLSSALGVPSDYLLKGEETPSQEGGDPLSQLINHVSNLLPFDKREMLLEYALLLMGNSTPRLNIPYYSDARAYADYVFRQKTDGSLPVNLSVVLDRFGVSLIESELEDCEAMLIQGNENLIILDPRQENLQRKRFTLAILLGHLIIPWHTATVYRARGNSSFKTHDIFEMEAAQFAASLLMPREILKKDLQASLVSLESVRKLAGVKYDVSVFAIANSLVDLYPNKFSVVQNDGKNALKVFQGSRPIRKDIDPNSLAAGFYTSLPEKTELRTSKLEENTWFEDGKAGAYVLEESIYDPQFGTVLSLITII
jgi:transcriptional regulator with XRE-family HTH domain/Zn-dependent peptidase ImmA (M78 family)